MHEIFTDFDTTQRKICATFREVCLFDRNRATLSWRGKYVHTSFLLDITM